jgi:ABC-type Fe3+/spermidine/putrescine transport system ATPase subunit
MSVAGRQVRVDGVQAPIALALVLGVRPEQMSIGALSEDANNLPGRVVSQQFSGSIIKIGVEVEGGMVVMVDSHPNDAMVAIGSMVSVRWNPARAVVLHA